MFSHDTSQNTHLTLEIQALIEPNIINKDTTNRGQIATSRFPDSPSLTSLQIETIFLSSPEHTMIGDILPVLGHTQKRIQNPVRHLR